MSKFMLILADNPASFRDVPPTLMQEIIGKYIAWNEKLQKDGRLLGGEKLSDEGGRRIQKRGEKPVVVDGPYAEAAEVVGGYYLIQAKDYAEATAIALTCPHVEFGAYLDVRKIDEM